MATRKRNDHRSNRKVLSRDYFLVELHLTIIIQGTAVVDDDDVAKDTRHTENNSATILSSVFIYFIFVRF